MKKLYILLILIAPAISFAQWTTSGTNVFHNTTGLAGIGTATATTFTNAKLNVYKSGNGTAVLIGNPNIASGNFTSLRLGTSADLNGYSFINSIKSAAATPVYGDLVLNQAGGNVGIGTTTPSAKLNVYQAGASTRLILGNPLTGSGGFTSLILGTSADKNGYTFLSSVKSSGSAYGDLVLNIDGGNVGIGKVPASTYKLDVNGTINAKGILLNDQPLTSVASGAFGGEFHFSNNQNVGFTWWNENPTIYGIYRTAGEWSHPNYQQLKLSWDTGIILNPGTAYGKSYVDVQGNGLRISSGALGIGTTDAPSEKLEVNGNISLGLSAGSATGYGNRLNLRGLIDDGDPIWMSRYNAGPNQTELRVNIGDDAGGDDSFTVGNFFYGDGQWKTFMKVQNNGNVGIGTTNPGSYKLAVAGKIAATGEVKVFVDGTTTFPDYVFDPSYKLPTLEETEKYVKENHHLPEVPSAAEIEKEGMSLNGMNVILLKKVEELTLHLIEMKKGSEAIRKENEELKKRLEKLEKK